MSSVWSPRSPFPRAWLAEVTQPRPSGWEGAFSASPSGHHHSSIPALVFPPIVPTLPAPSHNNEGLSRRSPCAGEKNCK